MQTIFVKCSINILIRTNLEIISFNMITVNKKCTYLNTVETLWWEHSRKLNNKHVGILVHYFYSLFAIKPFLLLIIIIIIILLMNIFLFLVKNSETFLQSVIIRLQKAIHVSHTYCTYNLLIKAKELKMKKWLLVQQFKLHLYQSYHTRKYHP